MAFQWTSGNGIIDKIIKDSQLTARNKREVIEWIPYDRLKNIQFHARGGFSTVYLAIWLDGRIRTYWNNETNQLDRKVFKLNEEDFKNARNKETRSPLQKNEKTGFHVVLKCLNNSSNDTEGFLNEWKNYLKFIYSTMNNNCDSIRLYGITQDPVTLDYMIVMEYMSYDLYQPYISASHRYAYISDFGLSRSAHKSDSNEVYGVLPYIAPEVLRGKPYTKASDIYSFGICKGNRPEIIDDTEPEYVELMKKCWDSEPNKRPSAEDLIECFKKMRSQYYSNYDRVQVPENEVIIQNHPLSCYTSRKINYSTELNEILKSSESSESLEHCRVNEVDYLYPVRGSV
ncbi:kinase-like domain-containing protein [Rhizophagus irregularis DAOM 181602=DAOM 197198]|nr:kinase-like domain-containing protein [Rhizophagus irregularis DAOM 181602=DAOM 197198]